MACKVSQDSKALRVNRESPDRKALRATLAFKVLLDYRVPQVNKVQQVNKEPPGYKV